MTRPSRPAPAADRTARVGGLILCDSRAGSSELARYVVPQGRVRVASGLPTDVVTTGWGPNGRRVEIGIEHKRIDDVLKCIDSGRFAGKQLGPLRDFEFAFLIVEGIFRGANGSSAVAGALQIYGAPLGKPRDWYTTDEMGWGKRVWRYTEVEHWLFTMQLAAGITVLPFCATKHESGRLVGSVWEWFNHKQWDEHRSHLAKDRSHIAPLRGEQGLALRAAAELPGAGAVVAPVIEERFGSWCGMAAATVEEWAETVVGGGRDSSGHKKRPRRLGRKTAAAIHAEIHDGCLHDVRPKR